MLSETYMHEKERKKFIFFYVVQLGWEYLVISASSLPAMYRRVLTRLLVSLQYISYGFVNDCLFIVQDAVSSSVLFRYGISGNVNYLYMVFEESGIAQQECQMKKTMLITTKQHMTPTLKNQDKNVVTTNHYGKMKARLMQN